MNIAYLISQYPAVSHTFILREVLGLRSMGCDIKVASINYADRQLPDLTLDERTECQNTFYVKRQGVLRAFQALLISLLTAPRKTLSGIGLALRLANRGSFLLQLAYWAEALILWQWARRESIDHLHVHFATPAAMVGLLFSRMSGIPFSITVHGPDEFYDVKHYCLREKFMAAHSIICISEYARSQVMRILPCEQWAKIEVCRLGVFPGDFPWQPRDRALAGAPLRLLCVGRLCEAKGQALLIQAVARLRLRGIDCHLTLVGGGDLRAEFEALVKSLDLTSSVTFTGPLNQDLLRKHFAAADIFVLASFAEGVPIVLMEAMALGIPVLSTRITGIPELIVDGENGTLVSAGSMIALADALEGRINLAALEHERQVSKARQRIEEDYNLELNVAALRDIFTRILSPRLVK